MCGIAGIFDLRGRREIERRPLQAMSDALEHRGPDGAGLHVEPGVGLVHRRLSIIDLDGGTQPFTAGGGRTVLTYNGEIYNHTDLREPLRRAGRTLRTRCDTEVLAELLDLRGEDALHDLRGMFAFAAWSPRENTLTLARDRFGEKPLYYARTKDDFLVFASEMPALLASGLVPNLIEERSVADYLFYGYVPDPQTIYRGVERLAAGHVLTLRRGGAVRPRRWYGLRQSETRGLSPTEAGRATARLLDDAVAEQRLADVPLGAFLSGGIDSSSVVTVMAAQGPPPVTCTVGFDDAAADERAPAAALAEALGTHHHEDVARVDVDALLPAVARAYGEPFADAAALPAYLVCQLARTHVNAGLAWERCRRLGEPVIQIRRAHLQRVGHGGPVHLHEHPARQPGRHVRGLSEDHGVVRIRRAPGRLDVGGGVRIAQRLGQHAAAHIRQNRAYGVRVGARSGLAERGEGGAQAERARRSASSSWWTAAWAAASGRT